MFFVYGPWWFVLITTIIYFILTRTKQSSVKPISNYVPPNLPPDFHKTNWWGLILGSLLFYVVVFVIVLLIY